MRKFLQLTMVIGLSAIPLYSQNKTNKEILKELINATYPIPVMPPEYSKSVFTEHITEGNIKYNIESETVKLAAQFESMVAFNPNTQGLWPGCVVQGKDLPDGILTPINFPRNSISLGITNLQGKKNTIIDTTITRPSFTR